jgi:uncharacterized protein YqfA (UPF0365 family)
MAADLTISLQTIALVILTILELLILFYVFQVTLFLTYVSTYLDTAFSELCKLQNCSVSPNKHVTSDLLIREDQTVCVIDVLEGSNQYNN